MDKKQVLQAIEYAKQLSQKRNFKQSVELIINLKGLDLKKPEHQVELFIALPKPRGKDVKLCALVGPELEASAKESCDQVILLDDFDKVGKDKKSLKKIARQFDFFIAQANIMPKVASAFGRILGPKGKMPNPKAGCVVPPKANLKPLRQKLINTVKISAKVSPLIQCFIGKEDTPNEDIAENIITIYDQLVHSLPNEVHNIQSIFVKLTMGKSIKVGREYKVEQQESKQPKKKAKKEAKKSDK